MNNLKETLNSTEVTDAIELALRTIPELSLALDEAIAQVIANRDNDRK